MRTERITCQIPVPDDAAVIADLHVTSWRETYTGMIPPGILENADMADRTARWRGYLETSGSPIWVARVDGEVSGFIHAGPVKEPVVEGADGHIFALYILERFHRKGIGRRLIGLVARDWSDQGGRALSVGVLTANHKARAFYEALGARFVRPAIYPWHGHDLEESIYIFENIGKISKSA